ncbi:DNA-3-methyladenine glycosylase [Yinghuangia sp. ASG 101]|uniref:DNA-3-methyladenine glycosylase n=1 Tax=Yinghuangia sp. ASG 101 TaxID=2896848 RepID=UPI001E5F169D|nr:DNA-3-methyladenine glycosylase [Yinghuangia sp. ASG 101]UGQ10237.1 DNA-3-methyladenine glycosylase [Yinghuangia sp. ASG 101]
MPDASRRVLPRSFFARPVLDVAPEILGRLLVRDTAEGPVTLRITEVEAYDGANDPGSHAYRGKTPRNATMFGPAGHLYVYFTYGMHHCVNVVCGTPGKACGLLIRAGEITGGVASARARRPGARRDTELAQGPARLTVALGIGRADDGVDACAPGTGFRLLHGTPVSPERIRTGPRTGVAGLGGDPEAYPWRFHVADDRTVSPYRAHVPRVRRNTVRAVPDPSGTL